MGSDLENLPPQDKIAELRQLQESVGWQLVAQSILGVLPLLHSELVRLAMLNQPVAALAARVKTLETFLVTPEALADEQRRAIEEERAREEAESDRREPESDPDRGL